MVDNTIPAQDIKGITVNSTNPVSSTNSIANNLKVGVVSSSSANLTQNIATTVSNLPQIAPDWTNRRKAIFISVWFSVGSLGLIVITMCFGLVYSIFKPNHGASDIALVSLAQFLVIPVLLFLGAVIGAYCFGAGWEYGQYRDGMLNMVSKIATSGTHSADEDKHDDNREHQDDNGHHDGR